MCHFCWVPDLTSESLLLLLYSCTDYTHAHIYHTWREPSEGKDFVTKWAQMLRDYRVGIPDTVSALLDLVWSSWAAAAAALGCKIT